MTESIIPEDARIGSSETTLTATQGASVLISEGHEPRVLIPVCCSRDLVAVKCLEWCFIFFVCLTITLVACANIKSFNFKHCWTKEMNGRVTTENQIFAILRATVFLNPVCSAVLS